MKHKEDKVDLEVQENNFLMIKNKGQNEINIFMRSIWSWENCFL